MLKTDPARFQQKAREWAIMHADAPQSVSWKGASGGSSTISKQMKNDVSEEERQRQELARYAISISGVLVLPY
jgi:hypothetical protein